MQNYDEPLLRNRRIDPRAPFPIAHQAVRIAMYDEYAARSFYARVVEAFGPRRPFANIVHAEERHIAALGRLCGRLGIPRPLDPFPLETQIEPTWLVSKDGQRVAAVLQADYSCALKLATPVAFKSAMYQAGQRNILIKSANALERLAKADTFVFDKTGTLTSGILKVTDSISFGSGYTPEDLINLAASVEEHYFHPLAHAAVIDRLRGEGKTLLYIGFGGELLGLLALTDTVRENGAATVARLRELGVKRILMLTGDQPDRARTLAQTLGLDEFRAGLLPSEKARVLQELAAQGADIAFVGDGVNDAPALTGAQVGIAMHCGADVARLASDITLLEDDIARLADARALALATRRLIDSNFKLTVGLNTGILSAAALGLLSPVAASMLHNGSTIAILLRALVGAGLPRGAKPKRKPAPQALGKH